MFFTVWNKQELAGMHVARVTILALLREYSLHAWPNGAVFAAGHCLLHYVTLCGATF